MTLKAGYMILISHLGYFNLDMIDTIHLQELFVFLHMFEKEKCMIYNHLMGFNMANN